MAKPSTSKRTAEYRIEVPEQLDLEPAQLLELQYFLVLNRRLDDKLGVLYRQGKVVGGLYSSLGQEATSCGTAYALRQGDFVAPMIRNAGSYLVRGVSAESVMAQYCARASGPTGGKDLNLHFGDLSRGMVAPVSVLGTLIPVMVGVAMAMKRRRQPNVSLTYIGDGGTSTTDFHEGLNLAAVQKVPFILICEHNQYAYSTHTSRQMPVENIADKAESYGVYGEIFDGNNVLAAYDATRRARERCIAGNGPVMLEAKTFRRKGHAEHDPAGYVDPSIRAEWEAKDPLDAYRRFLLDERIATEADVQEIDHRVGEELNAAVDAVLQSAFPEPEVALENVYYTRDHGDGGSQ